MKKNLPGLLIASLFMMTFVFSSCDEIFTNFEGTDDEFPDGQGELRLMNLFEDREVDFHIGDRELFTDAEFLEITDFEKVSVGRRLATLLESDTGDTLFSERSNFIELNRNYNVYAFRDDDDSVIVRAVENDEVTDPRGDTRIRVFNAFKFSPALDVYFTDGDTDISDPEVPPTLVEIDFNNDPQQELVRYDSISPGNVTMSFTESGTEDVIYESEIEVEGEASYTILLYTGDEESGAPTDHLKLQDK